MAHIRIEAAEVHVAKAAVDSYRQLWAAVRQLSEHLGSS